MNRSAGSCKSAVIISVTSFHFSIVPRCSWSNSLVNHMNLGTKCIQRMNSVCLFCIGELWAVVCLNYFRCISEEGNGSFEEVHGRVAALVLVGVYKPLSACFLNYGVLKELFAIRTRIAGGWNIFYVHLPLDTQFCWGVVFAVMSWFFLGREHFFTISQFNKHAVQRTRMPFIALLLSQFPVQFTHADIRCPTMIVLNPLQFFFSMCVGMQCQRSVLFSL